MDRLSRCSWNWSRATCISRWWCALCWDEPFSLRTMVRRTSTVAVISYGLLGAGIRTLAGCSGQRHHGDMTPVTIIGVNPRGFTGAKSVQSSPEVFMPLSMIPLLKSELGRHGPYLSSTTSVGSVDGAVAAGYIDRAGANIIERCIERGGSWHDETGQERTIPRLVLEDGSRGLNFSGRQYAKPMYVLLALVDSCCCWRARTLRT